MKNSVSCELCGINVVRGIIHKVDTGYVCDDCKWKLSDSEGVYFGSLDDLSEDCEA